MLRVDEFSARLMVIDDKGVQRGVNNVEQLEFSAEKNQLGSVSFQLAQTHPMHKHLSGLNELKVSVWSKVDQKWVEPPALRYIITRAEADAANSSGHVKYVGQSLGWVFSKIVTHKSKNSDKLIALEKRAIDTLKDRRSKASSAGSKFLNHLTSVRSKVSSGKGSNHVGGSLPKKAKAGSILYHTKSRKLYRRSGTIWTTGKIKNTDVYKARQLYDAMIRARRARDAAVLAEKRAVKAARRATRDGKRPHLNATPGAVLRELIADARGRGNRLRGFSFNFSASRDSKGRAWKVRRDFTTKLGGTLLDVLDQLVEEGAIEWRTRGGILEVVNPGGFNRDRSESVAFIEGKDLVDGSDRQSSLHHASYSLLLGADERAWGTANASLYVTKWGVFESSISSNDSKTVKHARSKTAKTRTESRRLYKRERVRGVSVTAQSPHPMIRYMPGDLVHVHGTDGWTKQRVQRITVQMDKGGDYRAALVFDDVFTNAAMAIGKGVGALLPGTQDQVAGGVVPRVPDTEDKRPPGVGAVAVEPTVQYDAGSGVSKVRLLVSVTPDGLLGVEGGGEVEDLGYED